MTQLTYSAVDELAALRAEQAYLDMRAMELCDEILSAASQTNATQIKGASQTAIIETRRPRSLDLSKLPTAILDNPEFYTQNETTVVLLWPAQNQDGHPTKLTEPFVPAPSEPKPNQTPSLLQTPEPIQTKESDQSSAPIVGIVQPSPEPNHTSNDLHPLLSSALQEASLKSFDAQDAPDCTSQDDTLISKATQQNPSPHLQTTRDENFPKADHPFENSDQHPLAALIAEQNGAAFTKTYMTEPETTLSTAHDLDAVAHAESLQAKLDEAIKSSHHPASALQEASFSTRRIIGAPV